MERYTNLELSVGAFMLAGMLALGYLALTLGDLQFSSPERYDVNARFSSVSGLKQGDTVRVAGVSVGEVRDIALVDFYAQVTLSLDPDVKLPKDTMASIQSSGLLGDAFVALTPGAAEGDLAAGDHIARTEPAVSLTELIAKYAFGSPTEGQSSSSGSTSSSTESDKDSENSPFEDPLE